MNFLHVPVKMDIITEDFEPINNIKLHGKPLWPADKSREETPTGEPHGTEVTFNVDGGEAIVRTQHSHESGSEVRENLLKPGEEYWNKWLGNCSESWVEIDFKDHHHIIGGVGFKSANDVSERDPLSATVFYWDTDTNDWKQSANLTL